MSLEVRLIKQREHSVAIVRFKLSVDVLLAIDIYKVHTPIAIVVVLCSVPSTDIILTDLEVFFGKLNEAAIMVDLLDVGAINDELYDFLTSKIEEEVVVNINQLEVDFSQTFI